MPEIPDQFPGAGAKGTTQKHGVFPEGEETGALSAGKRGAATW